MDEDEHVTAVVGREQDNALPVVDPDGAHARITGADHGL